MELTLAGDVLIDVASKSDLAEHHKRIESLLPAPHRAHFLPLKGSVASAAKPLIVDLGTPPSGMIWLPQYVVITGSDPFGGAIANVTAACFVGPVPNAAALALGPPVTGLDMSGLRMPGLAVPSLGEFPDKTPIFGNGNEHLYVVLAGTGLIAGAAFYHVAVGVLELPNSPESLLW